MKGWKHKVEGREGNRNHPSGPYVVSAYASNVITLDMNTHIQKTYRQFKISEAAGYMPAYNNS